MYTSEQYQQAKKEVAKQHKTYDETSVAQAREKWLDARDRLRDLEAGRGNMDAILEARQREHDTKQELDTTQRQAGYLAAAAQERERVKAQEQAQHSQQVEQSAAEKSAFRKEALARWLAAGGSEHAFNTRFEDMYADEVQKRMQGPSEQEKMQQRMMASGRYSGVYNS